MNENKSQYSYEPWDLEIIDEWSGDKNKYMINK